MTMATPQVKLPTKQNTIVSRRTSPAVSNRSSHSNSSTTSSGAHVIASSDDQNVERRCDNPDCSFRDVLNNVPKGKTTQFITDPFVAEKPLLIDGFTTVFQIDGMSAKLGDIKTKSGSLPKVLYRIVPNTHAHIVNYVVIKPESDIYRKLKEKDPVTTRKVLESQRVSAIQMLQKLTVGVAGDAAKQNATVMGTQNMSPAVTQNMSPVVTQNMIPVVTQNMRPVVTQVLSPVVPQSVSPTVTQNMPSVVTQTMPPMVKHNMPPTPSDGAASGVGVRPGPLAPKSSSSSMTSGSTTTTGTSVSVSLPLRLHPNLKITSISGGSKAQNRGDSKSSSGKRPAHPLITPVPLANLQSAPPSSQIRQPSMPGTPSSVPRTVSTAIRSDKPAFEVMRAEIQELRRTVSLLSEAHTQKQRDTAANNNNAPIQTGAKRPRHN